MEDPKILPITRKYNTLLKNRYKAICNANDLPNDYNTDEDIPLIENTWFSTRILRQSTFEESSLTDQEFTDKTTPRVKLVALKVSKDLREHIHRAFKVTRMIYNLCVELCCKTKIVKATQSTLRKLLVNKNSPILSDVELLEHSQVPYDIKYRAVDEFLIAYRTQFTKLKRDQISHFSMGFRNKRKCLSECITLRHRDFSFDKQGKLCAHKKMWHGTFFEFYSEQLTPEDIKHDSKIIRRKNGKYYLAIPIDIPTPMEKSSDRIVALDPGVRIFQTTYDNQGNSYAIGEKDIEKLDELGKIASRMRNGIRRIFNPDGTRSYIKEDKQTGQKLCRPAFRIERKIRNKIEEIHRKTAKFLCDNYDVVIIPAFESQDMVKKGKRKINGTTARRLIRWSHYKFKEFLKNKGAITGTRIVEGTEEYTSKTCGNCFLINNRLGSKLTWKCDCGSEHHRDGNAARNILIHNYHLI